jgi:hypothetical protein
MRKNVRESIKRFEKQSKVGTNGGLLKKTKLNLHMLMLVK